MARMAEDDLLSYLQALEQDAASFNTGTLNTERERAMREYFRMPYGTEEEGWSQIVTSDVQDTVEWILPDLLDIFTSTDQAVVFEPSKAKDVQGAQQATDACNYIFYKQNDGFLTLYSAFKDALLLKNCAVHWRKETIRVKTIIPVQGASAEMLAMLLDEAGDDAEIESAEPFEPPPPQAPPQQPPPGMPMQGPGGPPGAAMPPGAGMRPPMPGMPPQGPPMGGPPQPGAAPMGGPPPGAMPPGARPVPGMGGPPPGMMPPGGMRPPGMPPPQPQAFSPPQGPPPGMPPGMPPPGMGMPPMPLAPPEPLFNARIAVIDEKTVIRVEAFAPDDLLVQRNWSSPMLAECPYVCRNMQVTLSDLNLMGFKDVDAEELAASDEANRTQLKSSDWRQRGESDDRNNVLPKDDDSVATGWLRIEYVLVDFDGDGIAERREIYRLSTRILRNEECEQVPIATASPVLVPHHWDGMSVAEMVSDIQMLKTELTRQMLNNAYLANRPRTTVLTDVNWSPLANIDDLLDGRPGGVLRQRQPDAIGQQVTPWVGGQMFPMLEYIDDMRAQRTGISKSNTGIDPNTLRPDRTATEVAQTATAARQRIRLIARVLAETLMKPIFNGILKLLTDKGMKPLAFKLNGNFVEYDPNEWRDHYDMTINVGLGTGERQQQQAMLMGIFQSQMGLAQSPFGALLVQPQQIYNTQAKLVENAGFKNVQDFFTNPKGAGLPPQPPPPNPQAEVAQIKAQSDQQTLTMQQAHDAQLEQLRQASKDQESKNQLALQMSNDQRDAQREALQAQYKAQLDNATLEFNRWKTQLDDATKIRVAEIEAGAKSTTAQLDNATKAHATTANTLATMHATEVKAQTTQQVAEANNQAKVEAAKAKPPVPPPGSKKP